MPVAVNAYLINSNDHVYRSRMTLMDSEYQLEQIDSLVFIHKCFVGSLRHPRVYMYFIKFRLLTLVV